MSVDNIDGRFGVSDRGQIKQTTGLKKQSSSSIRSRINLSRIRQSALFKIPKKIKVGGKVPKVLRRFTPFKHRSLPWSAKGKRGKLTRQFKKRFTETSAYLMPRIKGTIIVISHSASKVGSKLASKLVSKLPKGREVKKKAVERFGGKSKFLSGKYTERFRNSNLAQKSNAWLYHIPVLYEGEYVFGDTPQFQLGDTEAKRDEYLVQRLLTSMKALGRRISITKKLEQPLLRLEKDMNSDECATVPSRMALGLIGPEQARSLEAWQALGIIDTKGREFPSVKKKLALYLPTQANKPAYLLIDRFSTALHYKGRLVGRALKQACSNTSYRCAQLMRRRFAKPKNWHERAMHRLKTNVTAKKGRLARAHFRTKKLLNSRKRGKSLRLLQSLSKRKT